MPSSLKTLSNMLREAFLFIFLVTCWAKSDQNPAVLSCLRFYRPTLAALFTCWKPQDKVKMHKMIEAEDLNIRLVFAKTQRDAIRRINTKSFEKFTYFLDMRCESAVDILREASTKNRFGEFEFLYSWFLLIDEHVDVSVIAEIFGSFKTRMDMDVKVVQIEGNDKFKMYELYNPGINVGVIVRPLGFGLNRTISLNSNDTYYESRKNMSGVLVRSGNVIAYPFKTTFETYMLDPELKKYDIYSKFHYQLFLQLSIMHGFRYNTSLAPSWFGNTSSGEDGGLAKMLWEDEIDITSAGCIIRLLGNERIDFYDFISPYYKFRSCFYFRNPGVVKPNFGEVLKPFAKESWMVTLYVTGIVIVCNEISSYIERRNNRIEDDYWFKSIFVAIAVFAQQGLDKLPSNIPSRIILLNLLICSLLLYNYYTSSLVSSLISTEPEVLKTIKDLLDSKLRVGIEVQPYTITYMTNRVKEDHYLDLLNRTKIYEHDQPNILTADEGIAKVHDGDFAFHAESITAYPLIGETFEQETICDLAEIGLINSDTSLMAQKKSQYKKLFQVSLRKMWQSGIIRKLHKEWVTVKPECLSSTRVIAVTINDLFMPFFLLAMGVLFSIVLLMVELSWTRIVEFLKRVLRTADKITTYVN